MPAQACTIATALKAQGYATGQFGKNHLGDLNKFLPTLHGFDEFFGYLYHLDAMSDPYWYSFPDDQDYLRQVRPAQPGAQLGDRHGRRDGDAALGQDRQAEDRRRRPAAAVPGHVERARTGRRAVRRPSTTWRPSTKCWSRASSDFMDKAKKDGKPFFVWHNTTRMHVFTFLSQKYQEMMNSKTNYGLEEAGMAQMDDSIGALLKHLDDIGEADNTIVIFTTDNGAEVFTWPDGGMTPFKATKGTVFEGGFRVPCHHPLAGQDQAGHGRERHLLRPRLVPHLGRRRRQSGHHRPAAEGREARRPDLQEPSRRLQPDGPARRARGRRRGTSSSTSAGRSWAPSGSTTSSSSSSSSPTAGPGEKVTTDMPTIVNIRQDPFERTPIDRAAKRSTTGAAAT